MYSVCQTIFYFIVSNVGN